MDGKGGSCGGLSLLVDVNEFVGHHQRMAEQLPCGGFDRLIANRLPFDLVQEILESFSCDGVDGAPKQLKVDGAKTLVLALVV